MTSLVSPFSPKSKQSNRGVKSAPRKNTENKGAAINTYTAHTILAALYDK